jgi:UDP-3-O-[3-hydroxymyristoyl] glucosamine N-acyltransferase
MGIVTRKKGRIDVHVTVNDLAVLVSGTVQGDGERAIRAAKPVAEAGSSDVTFVENERNLRLLPTCKAAAVVAPAALAARISDLRGGDKHSFIVVQVKDALAGFVAIVQHLHGQPEPPRHGIDPLAFVHPGAKVGADASVFPFVSVGEGSVIGARCRLHSGAAVGRNCRLGDDVTLHPHAVLYDNTVLGDRVILHAHAVIGADGFGYRMHDGKHIKSPQFGWVEIGDDVEVGAGTTIDRGTFQPTRIGAGTKLDNLVQIGHNCQIGRHNLFVSHVGMAGSCSTGDYVVLAGQVGIADHVHLGDRAQIGAQSGVASEVSAGVKMLGSPARPEGKEKRIIVSLERLPAVCRDVRRIKRQLGMPDET